MNASEQHHRSERVRRAARGFKFYASADGRRWNEVNAELYLANHRLAKADPRYLREGGRLARVRVR